MWAYVSAVTYNARTYVRYSTQSVCCDIARIGFACHLWRRRRRKKPAPTLVVTLRWIWRNFFSFPAKEAASYSHVHGVGLITHFTISHTIQHACLLLLLLLSELGAGCQKCSNSNFFWFSSCIVLSIVQRYLGRDYKIISPQYITSGTMYKR